MAIQKVGVVGCGLMGSGIAQVCAQAGFTTVVREVSGELVEKGLKSIEKNLARLVEKGTLTEAAKNEVRGRLKGTASLRFDCGSDHRTAAGEAGTFWRA
jgi:3-hydroxybutyryl-CoA dehydrogenase